MMSQWVSMINRSCTNLRVPELLVVLCQGEQLEKRSTLGSSRFLILLRDGLVLKISRASKFFGLLFFINAQYVHDCASLLLQVSPVKTTSDWGHERRHGWGPPPPTWWPNWSVGSKTKADREFLLLMVLVCLLRLLFYYGCCWRGCCYCGWCGCCCQCWC